MSVFTQKSHQSEKVKHNNFDMSFTNNLTLDIGKLYPVFCKEVLPTESWRIKPSFGLRLDPTIFPLQTKIRADLHFFYVRNRNLWENWQEYITGMLGDGHPFPYLDQPVEWFETGKLADYLGIPTTVIGEYNGNKRCYCTTENKNLVTEGDFPNDPAYISAYISAFGHSPASIRKAWYQGIKYDTSYGTIDFINLGIDVRQSYLTTFTAPVLGQIPPYVQPFTVDGDYVAFTYYDDLRNTVELGSTAYTLFDNLSFTPTDATLYVLHNINGSGRDGVKPDAVICGAIPLSSASTKLIIPSSQVADAQKLINRAVQTYGSCFFVIGLPYSDLEYENPTTVKVSDSSKTLSVIHFIPYISFPAKGANYTDLSHISSEGNPFINGDLPLSALPCRAYESIVNAYYRDVQNDPLIINGETKYNQYCTMKGDGADGFDYKLMHRRWEADQFISAMQSPQQGVAPLVGLVAHPSTGTADFQFQSQDPDAPDAIDKITVSYDVTSGTIDSITSVDGANHATLINLVDAISTGISINELRNVNSLQRWLERNIHLGYRYKEQLESHFGKSPSFDVLDMPEFIGGTSKVMDMRTIRQTAPAGDGVLGSYAGFAELLQESERSINKYCDEHGFIIGILSIIPVPSYSQTLPKHFTKTHNHLDYFFPEFRHLGYQPIPYAELCPLQKDNVNETFGYQHAWYDYQSSLDEVHGLFRTTLQDYILSRIFNTAPSLTNPDFLYVNEDSLNNPFPVTEHDKHHVKGIVSFEVVAKRQISKFGMPCLE